MTNPTIPFALRECTICPPWVVRCAHFEGSHLWLFERSPEPCCRCDEEKSDFKHPANWVVAQGVLGTCSCNTHSHMYEIAGRYFADERRVANADFNRCEAELLGRSEAQSDGAL